MPDPGDGVDGVDLTPAPTRLADGPGSGTGRRRLGPILLVVVLALAHVADACGGFTSWPAAAGAAGGVG